MTGSHNYIISIPKILSSLGHFLIITLIRVQGGSENTLILYPQDSQLGPCFLKCQLAIDQGLPRFPIYYFAK